MEITTNTEFGFQTAYTTFRGVQYSITGTPLVANGNRLMVRTIVPEHQNKSHARTLRPHTPRWREVIQHVLSQVSTPTHSNA